MCVSNTLVMTSVMPPVTYGSRTSLRTGIEECQKDFQAVIAADHLALALYVLRLAILLHLSADRFLMLLEYLSSTATGRRVHSFSCTQQSCCSQTGQPCSYTLCAYDNLAAHGI